MLKSRCLISTVLSCRVLVDARTADMHSFELVVVKKGEDGRRTFFFAHTSLLMFGVEIVNVKESRLRDFIESFDPDPIDVNSLLKHMTDFAPSK